MYNLPFNRRIKIKVQKFINKYLPKRLNKKTLNEKMEYNLWIFKNLKGRLSSLNYDFKNKNILEIGPGYLFGLAYLFLAEGAKNVRIVDSHNWMKRLWRYKHIMQHYQNYIKKIFDKDIGLPLYPDESTYRLQLFINGHGNSGYTENDVDFIYSNACIEHVRNVESLFSNLFRVLKSGGIMVHQIDLRDHYDFNKPLDYLMLSHEEWETQDHPDDSYTNRLRVDNYRDILAQYPHRKLAFISQFDENFKAPRDLNERFRGKTEVNAVGLFMIVEKL